MKISEEKNIFFKYRPELDGLRALAVIFVITNHFNKEIIPSGYLGVDIFFVISGYVITSSLFKRPTNNFKNFIISFYERRIKRILPALLFFVLFTSILISVFSQSPGNSLKTGLSSLFGLSNLYLYNLDVGYFTLYPEFNSFTHTWSLAVEEQFYLLFPFLIWFSGFGSQAKNSFRNLFISIIVLTISSLILFIHFYPINQSFSYFLMPARFWEISSGCLIFLGMQKNIRLIEFLKKIPSLLTSSLVIATVFLPVSSSGFSTIAIVIISSILIVSLKKETTTYKILTNPILIYLGKLSYSLYLWHWGVLVISRWTIGIYWWTIPFQVLLILIISLFSYKFIETPFRKSNWDNLRLKNWIISGATLFSISGIIFLLGKPFKGYLYVGKEPLYTLRQYKTCHLPTIFDKNKRPKKLPSECGSLDAKNLPTIFGIGDSHIDQFDNAIAEFAYEKNYNYAIAWQAGCLFPSSILTSNKSSCYKNQTKLQSIIISSIKPGDIVIVGNALNNLIYTKESSKEYSEIQSERLNKRKELEIYKQRFLDFSSKVNKQGGKVVFYIDSLFFPDLNIPGHLCGPEWFRSKNNIPDKCKNSLSNHIYKFDEYFGWRADWSNNINKFVFNAYLYAEDCKDDICLASKYNDKSHFTAQYAKKIFYKFAEDNPSLFTIK